MSKKRREYSRQYYQKNKERIKEYNRNYYKKWWKRNPEKYERHKQRMRKYPDKGLQQRPPWGTKRENKNMDVLNRLTEKQKDMIKTLAKEQQILPKYIKKGECEVCGEDGTNYRLVAHHISYSPLRIITLCRGCHQILHLWVGYKVKHPKNV